jgi:hypothetical protein
MVTNLLGMKNIKYFALAAFLGTLATACKKEVFDSTVQLKRQFLPTNIKITAGETAVQLNWSPALFTVPGKVSYTVLVSTDSTFQSPGIITKVTDTSGVKLTDDELQVRTKYFALVKANGAEGTEDSRWGLSPSFRITGEQIFSPVLATETKDKSVILRWRAGVTGLTKVVLSPANATPIEVSLNDADLTASFKIVESLSPSTLYQAEIFAGTKSKGITTFTTKEPSIFTQVITPANNLATVIANAANGEVIGLEAGTYNVVDAANAFVNLVISQKLITIQSVSGNPADTKINFKEIVLAGTGAGVILRGIEFDGAAANASYFINLVGSEVNNALAATFSSITVDNCNVHNLANCFIRADRGAAAGDFKIGTIKVTNSKAYDSATGSTYVFFTLGKLAFERLELTNSTFYNMGRAFIAAGTTLPTSVARPVVLIDRCTINNFGSGGTGRNYTIFDASANPVDFTLQNSIVANTPIAGQTLGNAALRGTASTLVVTNNNMFKVTNGATPAVALTFPIVPTNQKTVDLGWTGATTDFSLPASSELRTSATDGGAVGDPRWVK